MTIADKIRNLPGPVCILGASGFIGANLFRLLSRYRDDVYGCTRSANRWRLQDVDAEKLCIGDLDAGSNDRLLFDDYKTVFNYMAYGAYSWQDDKRLIYETNFELTRRIVEELLCTNIA